MLRLIVTIPTASAVVLPYRCYRYSNYSNYLGNSATLSMLTHSAIRSNAIGIITIGYLLMLLHIVTILTAVISNYSACLDNSAALSMLSHNAKSSNAKLQVSLLPGTTDATTHLNYSNCFGSSAALQMLPL
jgi:hypothetical protein